MKETEKAENKALASKEQFGFFGGPAPAKDKPKKDEPKKGGPKKEEKADEAK